MNLAPLTALKNYDVSEIFGIPGDFALPFFKVIKESAIVFIEQTGFRDGVQKGLDLA